MEGMHVLPGQFCWTRFGTEAGEKIDSILERKERERLATGGVFLWGIGNSVGPAMRDLVRLEKNPMVVFSPMRSKPKAIDVAPSGVLQWTSAEDLDGNDWPMPEGIKVTSRQGSDGAREKRSHYALVCKANAPLKAQEATGLLFERLVNLQSESKLGASQVTAVVKHLQERSAGAERETFYPIAFTAELVFPYFVRLWNPVNPQSLAPKPRRSTSQGYQSSLLAL